MKILSIALFLTIAALSVTAQTAKISADDLKVLEGSKWTGSLVYMDYGSGKKTSIKSDLAISRKPGDSDAWIFAYEYPDEPKANSSSEVQLIDGGKTFNGGSVIEKARTSDGETLRVVTTKPGTDNNRKALFRYSYLIGAKVFAIKKEVQLEGSSEWFIRNEYSWSR